VSRFILSILVVFLLADVLWWWFAKSRFPQPTLEHRRRRRLITALFTVAILSLGLMIAARMLRIDTELLTPQVLIIFTLVWHLLALPVALVIILLHGTTQAGKALFALGRKPSPAPVQAAESTPEPTVQPSRRDFLAHVGAFAPVVLAGAGTAYSTATLSSLRVREVSIPIAGLPSGLDGLTIAHVTDTHLGRFTDAKAFRQIVSTVNGLDADLILHTGDLINDDQRHLPMACELMREMKSRHGLFLCEGNHDLIGGRESFYQGMRNEQMPLLIDQIGSVSIKGHAIEILGLPWTRGARTSGADGAIAEGVNRLASRRSSSAFPILLAHHPHAFDAAVENRIPLTLGGHTHGGQMNLTPSLGFGPAMYRYWSGLYSRVGCHTFVSNGSGNWFPLRINAPAEVARITLRRA
jgi:uncharacterized protein